MLADQPAFEQLPGGKAHSRVGRFPTGRNIRTLRALYIGLPEFEHELFCVATQKFWVLAVTVAVAQEAECFHFLCAPGYLRIADSLERLVHFRKPNHTLLASAGRWNQPHRDF